MVRVKNQSALVRNLQGCEHLLAALFLCYLLSSCFSIRSLGSSEVLVCLCFLAFFYTSCTCMRICAQVEYL
jgi:hypothetical protein